MTDQPNPLRQLSPFLVKASRRWRAGDPLYKIQECFPQGFRSHVFGAENADERLMQLICEVRAYTASHPGWLFPERPPMLANGKIPEEWIWTHAEPEDLPHEWGERLAERYDRRHFNHEMRGHQRADLGDAGRPCLHQAYHDTTDDSMVCRHCGLQLRGPSKRGGTDALVNEMLAILVAGAPKS